MGLDQLALTSRAIADHRLFQRSVTVLILLAALSVGLATYPAIDAAWGGFLNVLDYAILGLFTVEIVIRILAEGRTPLRFFRDGWNNFDFIIVAAGFAEFVLPFETSFLVAFRLLRLLRVLRLLTAFPGLQLLVGALLKSVSAIGSVAILLMILFFVYGVLGVHLFAGNDPQHFGSLHQAMVSLFQVVTLEGWDEIFRTAYYGCELAPADIGACDHPEAQPILAVMFFCSFILLGTMVALNLVIGVILSSMETVMVERRRQDRLEERARVDASGEPPPVAEELARLEEQLIDLTLRVRDLAHRHERS